MSYIYVDILNLDEEFLNHYTNLLFYILLHTPTLESQQMDLMEDSLTTHNIFVRNLKIKKGIEIRGTQFLVAKKMKLDECFVEWKMSFGHVSRIVGLVLC